MEIKPYLIITIISTIIAVANPKKTEPSIELKNICLNCHSRQKIPSELVYRRYLMRYSTNKNMQKAILEYLKNPNPKNSIMPKQFFFKFPKKERSENNISTIKRGIEEYLNYFDIKNKLILPFSM